MRLRLRKRHGQIVWRIASEVVRKTILPKIRETRSKSKFTLDQSSRSPRAIFPPPCSVPRRNGSWDHSSASLLDKAIEISVEERLTDVPRDVSSALESRGQLHDTLKLLTANRTPDSQLTRLVTPVRARFSHLQRLRATRKIKI